jgi:type I restriction enzyme S subunit
LGVSKFEGIVSPAYFVCRPSDQFDPRFLHYLLRSSPYLQELTRISKWMPPSQFDIPWEQLRLLPVVTPPKSIQTEIADYLDSETARIDALVAGRHRMVRLLEERAESTIRNLIATSPLIDSTGATIPVLPIKRVLTKLERPAIQGAGMITAFRDGTVTARSLRRTEGFTDAWTSDSKLQGVEEGDVVVHGLDGFAGAIGRSDSRGVCSPVYHVCVPKRAGDSVFLGALLRILAVDGYLGLFAVSTRQRAVDFRNWELFGRIPIPCVSAEKQSQISEHIRRIAPYREVTDRSAQLAMEHRQALISATVFGQVDYPKAAA